MHIGELHSFAAKFSQTVEATVRRESNPRTFAYKPTAKTCLITN